MVPRNKGIEYKTKHILNLNDPILKRKGLEQYSSFMSSDVEDFYTHHSIEDRCFKMACKIVKAYWEIVIEDMMENDITLQISNKPLFKMKITFLRNFKSKCYWYRPKTNGLFYKMFFSVSKTFATEKNVYYFVYSLPNFIKKLMSNIDQGRTWSQI